MATFPQVTMSGPGMSDPYELVDTTVTPGPGGYNMRLRRAQRAQAIEQQKLLDAAKKQIGPQRPESLVDVNSPEFQQAWQQSVTEQAKVMTAAQQQQDLEKAKATPPAWLKTIARLGTSNLYSDNFVNKSIDDLWAGNAPDWFAGKNTLLGEIERDVAETYTGAMRKAAQGQLGEAVKQLGSNAMIGMTESAYKAAIDKPSAGTIANAIMITLGAKATPLLPKALLKILNAGTQGIESLIGSVQSDQPSYKSILDPRQFTTEDGNHLTKFYDRLQDVKQGKAPFTVVEPSLMDHAREYQSALGKDMSAKYRAEWPALDKPFVGGDDPATWATYVTRHIAFSGADDIQSRKRAVERILSGENPEVVMRGSYAPSADAVNDRHADFEQYVQDYVTSRGSMARAKAILQKLPMEKVAALQADAEENAKLEVNRFGAVPGEELPLAELVGGTIIGMSVLDPANLIPTHKIFGIKWGKLIPKNAAKMAEELATRPFSEDMRPKIEAGLRGLSVPAAERLDNAREKASTATGAAGIFWKSYAKALGAPEFVGKTRIHVTQGMTEKVMRTLIEGADTNEEVLTRIGTFVAAPDQLIDKMGDFPISVEAEIARPAILSVLNEIPKMASLHADEFNPIKFEAEFHDKLARTAATEGLNAWGKAKIEADKPLNPAERVTQSAREWMAEFWLRGPNYTFRNFASDHILMATDGLLAMDAQANISTWLDRAGFERYSLGDRAGLNSSEGRRSKFSNVPGVGAWQNFWGDKNEGLELSRRERATYAAAQEYFNGNWKPKIDPKVYESLSPEGKRVAEFFVNASREAVNPKEIRKAFDSVFNAKGPADTFSMGKVLEDAGLPRNALSPEMQARVHSDIRDMVAKGAGATEIKDYFQKQRTAIHDDHAAKTAHMGDVVNPRYNSEDVAVKDTDEYQAVVGQMTKQLVKDGAMTEAEAAKQVNEMLSDVVNEEVKIQQSRRELYAAAAEAQKAGTTPEGIDRLSTLFAYARNEEFKLRDEARAIQGTMLNEAWAKIAGISKKKGNKDGKGQSIRAVWDEYREKISKHWNTALGGIGDHHYWAKENLAKLGTDPAHWDKIIADRPDVGRQSNYTEKALADALKLMEDRSRAAFEQKVRGSRYKVDAARRDVFEAGMAVIRANPELATDVFDILLRADQDVINNAVMTVARNRANLQAKDFGQIDFDEYTREVSSNWEKHFDFAQNRHNQYAQAQMLWLQARHSPVAETLRGRGYSDDAIAGLLSRQHTPEGREKLQRAMERDVPAPDARITARQSTIDQIRANTSIPEAQADEFIAIMDARADVWSRQTGRNPDEYYATRVQSIRAGLDGEPASATGLNQTAPARLAETKVVDEAGQPKRVYHYTISNFEKFDTSRLGARNSHPTTKLGTFFGSSPEISKRFGEQLGRDDEAAFRAQQEVNAMAQERHGVSDVMQLTPHSPERRALEAEAKRLYAEYKKTTLEGAVGIPVYLDMKNPYTIGWDEWQKMGNGIRGAREYVDGLRARLEREGYDGIILPAQPKQAVDEYHQDTYIVFNPDKQVVNAITGRYMQQQDTVRKGQVDFQSDGSAVITAFKAADITTLVHEAGHIFRRDLAGDDMDVAAEWAGAQRNERGEWQWSRDAEEKFARGFESYIKEGKAPAPMLQRAFDKLKDWITAIYAKIRGGLVNELSDEMRTVYDNLLADTISKNAPPLTADDFAREAGIDLNRAGPDELDGLIASAHMRMETLYSLTDDGTVGELRRMAEDYPLGAEIARWIKPDGTPREWFDSSDPKVLRAVQEAADVYKLATDGTPAGYMRAWREYLVAGQKVWTEIADKTRNTPKAHYTTVARAADQTFRKWRGIESDLQARYDAAANTPPTEAQVRAQVRDIYDQNNGDIAQTIVDLEPVMDTPAASMVVDAIKDLGKRKPWEPDFTRLLPAPGETAQPKQPAPRVRTAPTELPSSGETIITPAPENRALQTVPTSDQQVVAAINALSGKVDDLAARMGGEQPAPEAPAPQAPVKGGDTITINERPAKITTGGDVLLAHYADRAGETTYYPTRDTFTAETGLPAAPKDTRALYEKTRQEYWASMPASSDGAVRLEDANSMVMAAHEMAVTDAIWKGIPVPANVLDEYPAIKATFEKFQQEELAAKLAATKDTPEPVKVLTDADAAQAEANPQLEPFLFHAGDRVTYTNKAGETLTGTVIENQETPDSMVAVRGDQVASIGGRIPILRKDIMPASRFKLADDQPAPAAEPARVIDNSPFTAPRVEKTFNDLHADYPGVTRKLVRQMMDVMGIAEDNPYGVLRTAMFKSDDVLDRIANFPDMLPGETVEQYTQRINPKNNETVAGVIRSLNTSSVELLQKDLALAKKWHDKYVKQPAPTPAAQAPTLPPKLAEFAAGFGDRVQVVRPSTEQPAQAPDTPTAPPAERPRPSTIAQVISEVEARIAERVQELRNSGDGQIYISPQMRIVKANGKSELVSTAQYTRNAGLESVDGKPNYYKLAETPTSEPAQPQAPEAQPGAQVYEAGGNLPFRVIINTVSTKPADVAETPTSGAQPVFETPQTPAASTRPAPAGVKVSYDPQRNSINLKFPAKPDAQTLADVHRLGFKWSKFQSMWYAPDTPARRAYAKRFEEANEAVPAPEAPTKPDRITQWNDWTDSGKEPWQVSQTDYLAAQTGRGFANAERPAAEEHEAAVREAWRAGKDISKDVLADYPDLAKPPAAPGVPTMTLRIGTNAYEIDDVEVSRAGDSAWKIGYKRNGADIHWDYANTEAGAKAVAEQVKDLIGTRKEYYETATTMQPLENLYRAEKSTIKSKYGKKWMVVGPLGKWMDTNDPKEAKTVADSLNSTLEGYNYLMNDVFAATKADPNAILRSRILKAMKEKVDTVIFYSPTQRKFYIQAGEGAKINELGEMGDVRAFSVYEREKLPADVIEYRRDSRIARGNEASNTLKALDAKRPKVVDEPPFTDAEDEAFFTSSQKTSPGMTRKMARELGNVEPLSLQYPHTLLTNGTIWAMTFGNEEMIRKVASLPDPEPGENANQYRQRAYKTVNPEEWADILDVAGGKGGGKLGDTEYLKERLDISRAWVAKYGGGEPPAQPQQQPAQDAAPGARPSGFPGMTIDQAVPHFVNYWANGVDNIRTLGEKMAEATTTTDFRYFWQDLPFKDNPYWDQQYGRLDWGQLSKDLKETPFRTLSDYYSAIKIVQRGGGESELKSLINAMGDRQQSDGRDSLVSDMPTKAEAPAPEAAPKPASETWPEGYTPRHITASRYPVDAKLQDGQWTLKMSDIQSQAYRALKDAGMTISDLTREQPFYLVTGPDNAAVRDILALMNGEYSYAGVPGKRVVVDDAGTTLVFDHVEPYNKNGKPKSSSGWTVHFYLDGKPVTSMGFLATSKGDAQRIADKYNNMPVVREVRTLPGLAETPKIDAQPAPDVPTIKEGTDEQPTIATNATLGANRPDAGAGDASGAAAGTRVDAGADAGIVAGARGTGAGADRPDAPDATGLPDQGTLGEGIPKPVGTVEETGYVRPDGLPDAGTGAGYDGVLPPEGDAVGSDTGTGLSAMGDPRGDTDGGRNRPGRTGGRPSDGATLGDVGQPSADAGGPVSAGTKRPARPHISPADSGTPDNAERIPDGQPLGVKPQGARGRDYIISEADQIAGKTFSWREKYDGNIQAIKTLRKIEAEGRQATPEEQAILVKYVGWGGLSEVFDTQRYNQSRWSFKHLKEFEEVQKLLTDVEWDAAYLTTQNAHYTSPPIVKGIWDIIRRLGFESGRVLEPGGGIGHFFGLMPTDMAAASERTLVEIDPITARIAAQLYQNANVRNAPYQSVKFPAGYFDIAASNVPFAAVSVFDKSFRSDRDFLKSTLHDYYFAKTLDNVREGGLIAFITSKGTMDKLNPRVREYLAGKADLVGAIRFPNDAFKGNANTEVTTDLIILRKRAEGEAPAGESWRTLSPVMDAEGNEIPINEYFARHPEMMLGKMSLKGSMHNANEPTLESDGRDIVEAFQSAIEKLPQDIYGKSTAPQPTAADAELARLAETLKEGGISVKGGKAYQVVKGVTVELPLKDVDVPKVEGMLTIRDHMNAMFAAELKGDEAGYKAAQKALNKAYDAFSKVNKTINSPQNRKLLRGDPDQFKLMALERDYNAKTRSAKKEAIFTRKMMDYQAEPTSAATSDQALSVSLNRRAKIDVPFMARLVNKTEAEVIADLKGLVYHDPSGKWETSDAYLSGNVREKLRAAEEAAKVDPAYQVNVDELRKIQPEFIPPANIGVQLGSPWVPESVVNDYLRRMGEPGKRVRFVPAMGEWVVETRTGYFPKGDWRSIPAGVWKTEYYDTAKLIDDTLNLRDSTVWMKNDDGNRVIDNDRTAAVRKIQKDIKKDFQEWVFSDTERADELAAIYNEKFNSFVDRKYDGAHLTFTGMSPEWFRRMRPSQKNAVWRVIQGGNTLLAHEVGAGKTLTMIAAGMEMRRLGIKRKPMYVVLNSTLPQWESLFREYYPNSRILVADKDSMSAGNRAEFMSRIATGDWDAVVVPHTSFEKLPVASTTYENFMGDQIRVLKEFLASLNPKEDRQTVKNIAAQIESMQTKLQNKLAAQEKDTTIKWEELGVDQIFVDESHAYKNLMYHTKMQRGVRGLGTPTGSNRALDMLMKIRNLQERTGGGGVTFATGTPISNTLGEAYTIMRYLQPSILKETSTEHFDSWVKTFAETQLTSEPTATGYKAITRLSKFPNLPEMKRMMNDVMDIQTQEMLNLPRPDLEGGEATGIPVPASEDMEDFMKFLRRRAKELKGKPGGGKGSDNMLVINTDAKKAALDMRLVDPLAKDSPYSKVNVSVKQVFDIWKKSKKYLGTQLVFIDLSTPKAKGDAGYSAYTDIKEKLIAKGIPEKEIAFIHDYNNDDARARLFQQMNDGEVRVLLGSTQKLGTGVNVQKRLIAQHHLDVPYTPSALEQRDGRILRPGNMFRSGMEQMEDGRWRVTSADGAEIFKDEAAARARMEEANKPVSIYRYVAQKSLDEALWGLIAKKAGFTDRFMAENTPRVIEEDPQAVASAEMMAAMASPNRDLIMKKIDLDREVKELEMRGNAFEMSKRSDVWKLAGEQSALEREEAGVLTYEMFSKHLETNKTAQLTMELEGKFYDRAEDKEARAKIGEHLDALAKTYFDAGKFFEMRVGSMYGFDIWLIGTDKRGGVGGLADVQLRMPNGEAVKVAYLEPENLTGNLTRIENAVNNFAQIVENYRKSAKNSRDAIEEIRTRLDKPWEEEGRYNEAKADLDALMKTLGDVEEAEVYDGKYSRMGYSQYQDYKSGYGMADVFDDGDTDGAGGRRSADDDTDSLYQEVSSNPADNDVNVDPETLARQQDKEVEAGRVEGGPHYTDMADAARDQQLRALDAIERGYGEHAKNHKAPDPSGMMGDKAKIAAERERIVKEWFSFNQGMKTYAKKRADFPLLDYGQKRQFDLWLQNVVPFGYWATRQGRNYALRFINKPGLLAAYLRYQEAVKKENKKNHRRGRFGTSLVLPTSQLGEGMWDIAFDPTAIAFPFAQMFFNNDLDNTDEAKTTLQRAYDMAGVMGMRPTPLLDIPLRYSNLLVTKRPGEEGYDTEQAAYGQRSIGQQLPQVGAVQGITAALGLGGPGGLDVEDVARRALGMPQGEPFDAYRTARSLADMAAEENKRQGAGFDNRAYLAAQEFVANHGKTDLPTAMRTMRPEDVAKELKIDEPMAAQALALVHNAANRAAKQRGFQSILGYFTGIQAQQLPQGEVLRGEMRADEKMAAYNPLTGAGSREQVKAIQAMYPALAVQRAQYGALPGDEKNYSYLYDQSQRAKVNKEFDALKDAVVQSRPWDRKSARAIEDARWAALSQVERNPKAGEEWRTEYMKVMGKLTGVNVSQLNIDTNYRPLSLAGATPKEAREIRNNEIMRAVTATQPLIENYTNDDGEVDFTAYQDARKVWMTKLPMIAMGLPEVAAVMAASPSMGLSEFIRGLGEESVANYRKRNDTPIEAAQRAYFDQIYTPTWDAYRQAKEAGMENAWDATVGAIGPINGTSLAALVKRTNPGRFNDEQLAQVAQMNMPALVDVAQANMSEAGKRKDQARQAFWDWYRNETPPGKKGYKLRDIPLIAAALDQSSRTTLTEDQYMMAVAMGKGWMAEQYGGPVDKDMMAEWTQSRTEREQFNVALTATLGDEALSKLRMYEALATAAEKARYRRENPIVNSALKLRRAFEVKHPTYARYFGKTK
jgi:N12 class adenine-specific DNA methylase